MKEKAFRQLLDKYRKGTASDSEKLLMDKWFEEIGKEEESITWDEQRMAAMEQRLMQHTQRSNVRMLFPQWAKVAAALLLVAAAVLLAVKLQPTQLLTVSTQNETQKVILPDGSIIWLKENSSLTYPEKFTEDTRNVSFTGEALFEVEKDPAHPFIIACGNYSAKVLGTSFNLKTALKEIELTVLTGKVALTDSLNQTVIVTANEKIVQTNNLHVARHAVVAEEKTKITEGTEYNMAFHAETLTAIAARLEQKFNITIVLDNTAMGNCLLTGDFTDMSLTKTLDTMAKLLAFTYTENAKQVTLKGNGCE